MIECENCSNYIATGTECLKGYKVTGDKLQGYNCNDWLYNGDEIND